MINPAFLSQLEKNLSILISKKKYNEALLLISENKRKYKNDKKIEKIYQKIKDEIRIENKKRIDKEIENVKKLVQSKKYREALIQLKPFVEAAPNYNKLIETFNKIQKKYLEEIKHQQQNYLANIKKELKEIWQKNPEKVLSKIFELEKNNIGNKEIFSLSEEYKNKLIEHKIKQNQNLIESNKQNIALNFVQELKKISPKNQKVIKLENEIRNKFYQFQLEEKKEFIYKGKLHLDTLMKLKKYDKAILVAKELLEIDKNNEEIFETLKTAEAKHFKKTKKEARDKILKEAGDLKSDYQLHKEKYTKL